VENKTLKVSLARAANPTIVQANVYVANLPKHYTKADIEQMFIPYGPLIETKILLDPATGISKGVGFVRFASRDQAQIAIDSLNNHVPLGADTPIVVRYSDSKEDKARKGKAPSPAGFAYGAPARQIRYNPMAPPPQAAPSYGIPAPPPQVYQMYQTPMAPQDQMAAAAAAAAAAAPAVAFGAMYQPAPVVNPGLAYCLFVYNLPPDADESLLYRLFGPFGAISEVKIMRDATNRCKGFGFVHYLKLEDAQQAIISMNGYQLGNKFLQVSFKKQK